MFPLNPPLVGPVYHLSSEIICYYCRDRLLSNRETVDFDWLKCEGSFIAFLVSLNAAKTGFELIWIATADLPRRSWGMRDLMGCLVVFQIDFGCRNSVHWTTQHFTEFWAAGKMGCKVKSSFALVFRCINQKFFDFCRFQNALERSKFSRKILRTANWELRSWIRSWGCWGSHHPMTKYKKLFGTLRKVCHELRVI